MNFQDTKKFQDQVFQPENARQNITSPEELFINQNPLRMLCSLLGYDFIEGRHSSSGNRVDRKVLRSASPCNLTKLHWEMLCNSWDVWTRRWALSSVNLRGLLPSVFMAPGKGVLVSIIDPRYKVPPWSVPPMKVLNISVERSHITTWGYAEGPGGGP